MNFEQAAEAVKAFTQKPSDSDLLQLYGLFKQGTVGDVSSDRPGIFSPKERAKWDAWKANEGTSQDAAKAAYIKLATELSAKYK